MSFASKAAKKAADKAGLSEDRITGSGSGGAITKADVEAAAAGGAAPPDPTEGSVSPAPDPEDISKGELVENVSHRGTLYPAGTPVKDLGKLSDEESDRFDRLGLVK